MLTIFRVESSSASSKRRSKIAEKDNRIRKTFSIKLRNAIIALCSLVFIALLAVTTWALVEKGENPFLHLELQGSLVKLTF